MHSPVFLDDNNSGEGIFKQIDFTFSQKVLRKKSGLLGRTSKR